MAKPVIESPAFPLSLSLSVFNKRNNFIKFNNVDHQINNILFQRFIIEALTNLCGHFRTMPLQIRRLIGFLYGILHTRCFWLCSLLSLRHHMIHFIIYVYE